MTMTREELVNRRGTAWQRLGRLIDRASDATTGMRALPPAEISELSELYRSLAGDLMRVRRDKLGADLERHLDDLASRAHNLIYATSNVGNRFKVLDLILDFPGAIRRNWLFFSIAALLFFGPLFGAGIAAYVDESYAVAVLSPDQLESAERMYRSADFGTRGSGTDAAMSGFYVMNNVGIAFRCFATGFTFGLGSMFFLLYNGLVIGVIFGHLARMGLGETIFTFVSCHSPWELTAIAISGGAGIQMGYSMVMTRGRTRTGNLVAHGLELLRQIMGAAAFLFAAAAIEGWLSPSGLAKEAKYFIGFIGWIAVFVFIVFGGRDRPVPDDVLALRKGAS